VWSRSGDRLRFTECSEGEYSTLAEFVDSDAHAQLRQRSAQRDYEVETVSLTDMLKFHGAPSMIDYLSIDTEGSEPEILAAHDFNRFRFRIITVEHNGVHQRRNEIANLLSRNGYRRASPAISMFDDWYVLRAM
jgi:FkbM family methyltransferase